MNRFFVISAYTQSGNIGDGVHYNESDSECEWRTGVRMGVKVEMLPHWECKVWITVISYKLSYTYIIDFVFGGP